MASFNRIIIVGNLTRDPELKKVGENSLCQLNLASNRSFKNKRSGELEQEVCFVEVDVWGNQADNCKNYLQKGKSALVEGRLKLETWKEADGKSRSKHVIVADKVVFLSPNNGQVTEDISTKITDSPFEEDLPF